MRSYFIWNMVLDVRQSAVETAAEGIDFARNVLVVGTLHCLNDQERQRIEACVTGSEFGGYDEIR